MLRGHFHKELKAKGHKIKIENLFLGGGLLYVVLVN